MKILIVLTVCAVAVFAMPMNGQQGCETDIVTQSQCDQVQRCMDGKMRGQMMTAGGAPPSQDPTNAIMAMVQECATQAGVTAAQQQQVKAKYGMMQG